MRRYPMRVLVGCRVLLVLCIRGGMGCRATRANCLLLVGWVGASRVFMVLLDVNCFGFVVVDTFICGCAGILACLELVFGCFLQSYRVL